MYGVGLGLGLGSPADDQVLPHLGSRVDDPGWVSPPTQQVRECDWPVKITLVTRYCMDCGLGVEGASLMLMDCQDTFH